MVFKELFSKTLAVSLQTTPSAALWAIFVFVALIAFRRITSKAKHNLPHFAVNDNSLVKVLEEAHQKCPGQPFMVSLPGMELAVLPASEINTIKALPETEASIKKHHYDVFLGEYTYMGTKADEFDSTMRHVLTRNTPKVLASFVAEVEYAVNQQIGKCDEWTAVNARHAMSRIASLMSSRAFVGLPLSRDPEWIEATVDYTAGVSKAWMVLKMIPWPIRYFAAHFLPEVKALKRHRALNEEKLAPLLMKRQNPDYKKDEDILGGDLLDWYISQYEKPPTVTELTRDQLLSTFASIYNLSNALTYIILDLAATSPEDIEEMRQEVLDVVGDSGFIDKNSLARLRKIDSFARESQRVCPPTLANIPRIVTNPKGLKLSTGHIVPRGTRTTIMAHMINQDPAIYPEPDRFDPFRFSRLRDTPGNELKFQHTSTGLDNINFGHGLWACPGRFFANAEIKVIMAHLLLRYDIRLKPGTQKPSQQYFGLAILPDATAEVLFKARK